MRGALTCEADSEQHHIGALHRVAHRIHRTPFHVYKIKPREVTTTHQAVVDTLYDFLHIPVACVKCRVSAAAMPRERKSGAAAVATDHW